MGQSFTNRSAAAASVLFGAPRSPMRFIGGEESSFSREGVQAGSPRKKHPEDNGLLRVFPTTRD